MIRLCQQDPRWGDMQLKPSNLTMKRYGCTTTAVCMLADKFRKPITPKIALEKGYFKYTDGGLILWESIKVPSLKFNKRVRRFDKLDLRKQVADRKKGVILAVNNDAHWVAVRGRIPFTDHYWVNDPWDGKVKTTMKFFNISGAAVFDGEINI